MLYDNNETQFAVKHSSYTNAISGNLIDDLLAKLNTLVPSPIPSQIAHTLFDIYLIQLCEDAV